MNARSIGTVAVGLFVFLGADARAQVPEPGSQAVHISVAARTGNGPGQMISNGLLRFQEFQNAAFASPNITDVAVQVPDRIVLLQVGLISQLMDTLNLLLLGYQQSVLADFATDSDDGSPAVTDTTGSGALDDFFGDISGDG